MRQRATVVRSRAARGMPFGTTWPRRRVAYAGL